MCKQRSDTEFCLFIALGNEMYMASLTLLISKSRLFHADKAIYKQKLKELSLKHVCLSRIFDYYATAAVQMKRVYLYPLRIFKEPLITYINPFTTAR